MLNGCFVKAVTVTEALVCVSSPPCEHLADYFGESPVKGQKKAHLS